jgi:acetoin:2,6-dichlorophenolindophenol oxidoreductase subunit alpha
MLTMNPDVELYYRMLLIRRFEERVVALVNTNEIAGITHEYVGQEAVAVGVCAALQNEDIITSTHRGHGHLIAKGGNVGPMLAELMGREGGYNKGRGGSMHIAAFPLGVYGANGMVGAGAPMACGAAFRFRVAGTPNVAVAFFGDGAINQGVLHEALNLAAVWDLPVVFVCENNGYAVSTPVASVTRTELWQRGASYGMVAARVDGMDVGAVRAAAAEAVQRARSESRPTFLECRTYRYVGHQTSERLLNLNYRTDDEIAEWRTRDPIENWARQLTAGGTWGESIRAAVDQAVDETLEAGVSFARSSAWPAARSALDYMYATAYPGLPDPGCAP